MPFPPSKLRNRIPLSRQEMCGISQAISRDYSPLLFSSRAAKAAKIRFSPQELLDISRQISREFAPRRHDRQSRLVLMAVSPKRLHVYWHIAKRRLTQTQSEEPPELTLRIYTESEDHSAETIQNAAASNWFDIAISHDDGQQDIYLPEPITAARPFKFRAALGQSRKHQTFIPLLESNMAVVPQPAPVTVREDLPAAISQSIIGLSSASSANLTASGQGKDP